LKVLQINTTLKIGSTGRIVEGIGATLVKISAESVVAGAIGSSSTSRVIKIGNKVDRLIHGLVSRLFDRHGFSSVYATNRFIRELDRVKPDIVHLHNIHGYYLNVKQLFLYLKKSEIPIVWTFHDCWPFTGHCSYFDRVDCVKWKTACGKCPLIDKYPSSWGIDQSNRNYFDKKKLFLSVDNLTIVTPSRWLENLVRESFFKERSVKTIANGIDIQQFQFNEDGIVAVKKKYRIPDQKFLLGVANIWDDRKGLKAFIKLNEIISSEYKIVLVGLNDTQQKELPKSIIGIKRTESIQELASLYAGAFAYVNPTIVDNFPTTNLEAMSCGTPVITYNTGGCVEAIDSNTGFVIEKGDLNGIIHALEIIEEKGKAFYSDNCRQRVAKYFDMNERFAEYCKLYTSILEQKSI